MVSQDQYTRSTGTDGKTTTTKMFYDQVGNVINTRVDGDGFGFDEVTLRDLRYLETSKYLTNTWAKGAQGLSGATSFTYDINGQLTVVDRGVNDQTKQRSVASFDYDNENHIINRSEAPSGSFDTSLFQGYNTDPNAVDQTDDYGSGFSWQSFIQQSLGGSNGGTRHIQSYLYANGHAVAEMSGDHVVSLRSLVLVGGNPVTEIRYDALTLTNINEVVGYTFTLTEGGATGDIARRTDGSIDRLETARRIAARAYGTGFTDLSTEGQAKVVAYVQNQLATLSDAQLVAGAAVTLYGWINLMDGGYQNVIANGDYSYRQLGADGIPGGSAATHTVRSGDSLQSIATTYFGSPAYWYLIADANGLTGSEPLTEGTTLTIPNVAANSVNNNDTYKIYNENEIIGSTSPEVHTIPKKKKWWQKLIAIILIIIVIVVSFYAPQIAAYAGQLVAAAVTAVAGPVVGAVVGAVVSAAVGYTIGVATSAVTQGIAVLAGLQDKIDWKAARDMGKSFAVNSVAQFILPNPADAAESATNAAASAKSTYDVADVVVRAGVEAARQYYTNGKVTSWSGVALAGAGYRDPVVAAGLNIVEKEVRHAINPKSPGTNSMDWIGFALTVGGTVIDNPSGNTNRNPLVTQAGEMDWTKVMQHALLDVAGGLLVGAIRGQEAGINAIGSFLGNTAVKTRVAQDQINDMKRPRAYAPGTPDVQEQANSITNSQDTTGTQTGAPGSYATAPTSLPAPGGTPKPSAPAVNTTGSDTPLTSAQQQALAAGLGPLTPAAAERAMANTPSSNANSNGNANAPASTGMMGSTQPDNADTPPLAVSEADNAPPVRRLVTATVGKGQGPLQAYMDAGLSLEQAKAAYGVDIASGRIKLVKAADGTYVPSVKPGDELTADLDDTRFTKLAGRAISGESGYRDYVAAKKQYEAEQKAVQEQKVAQQRQADYVASSDQREFARANTAARPAAAPEPTFGQTFMGELHSQMKGVIDRLDAVGDDLNAPTALRMAAAFVRAPAQIFTGAVEGTGGLVVLATDSTVRGQVFDSAGKFLSNDPINTTINAAGKYYDNNSGSEMFRDAVVFAGSGMVGAPVLKPVGAVAGATYDAAKVGAARTFEFVAPKLDDMLYNGMVKNGLILNAAVDTGGGVGVANTEALATRRAYLNEKFGRTGDINLDINIRGNQEVASGFFRGQGLSEADANALMSGIDFTRPVNVQTLGSGKSLWQYQPPGAPQGNWYSLSPSVTPSELGINPYGVNRAAQSVELKTLNQYSTAQPVSVLRSTSAPVSDYWSVPGQQYPAIGGARQLFSTQKSLFIPVQY